MPLYLSNPFEDKGSGFQFLFFILPISRVFPDGLSQLVTSKLTTHAGFGKYGLLQTPLGSRPSARLEVEVREVEVQGYDLVVVRRPSASITLSATLHTTDGVSRACQTSGSYSEFARFAFVPDLENVLEQATDRAAQELIRCLGLAQFSEAGANPESAQ